MRQAVEKASPLTERKVAYFDKLCRESMWYEIWGHPRKDAPEDDIVALGGAKHVRDGNVFDEKGYSEFVGRLVSLVEPESEWVYEIGAGAGAMLSNIRKRFPEMPAAGCDSSAYLCELAPRELNISNHTAHRAVHDGAIPFGRGGRGVVLMVGVMMYFPDYMYADFVLTCLVRDFRHSTIIMAEVPDLAKKEEIEALRGPTGHLFFPRDFFRIYHEDAEIIDYELRGSINSGTRYMAVLNRR